jgi:hypothetical protein
VTSLTPNTRYYVTAFEYNGFTAPVFLKPGSSFDFTTAGPLPLKWLSFAAQEAGGNVILDWSTGEEAGARCFVIERSVNSSDFSPLDTIPAKGKAGRNDYHYEDGAAPAGQLAYRIREVDIDGRYEYSKYVMVRIAGQNSRLALYPNPAESFTRIQLPAGLGQAIVQVYTQSGLRVRTIQVSNLQLIDCSGLSKGIYYIVVRGHQGSYTDRLIIQ